MSRTHTYLMAMAGVVCVAFLIRLFFFTDLSSRTVRSDVVRGILIGVGLAFATAQVYRRLKGTKNGWVAMYGCGEPGNGMFLRAAHVWVLSGPINVPQEAMHWGANPDGAGRTLSGAHD